MVRYSVESFWFGEQDIALHHLFLVEMFVCCVVAVEGSSLPEEDVEMMENSDVMKTVTDEASPMVEPFIGMEFESEEAAKSFYDNYATCIGFVMRVDAFRRSMRDGTVVWRRLVCNKEGFRRSRPRRSESRKPRAITREGCKALIVVKREKSGNWLVTKFEKEHNHPLLPLSPNVRRNFQLPQTPVRLRTFPWGKSKTVIIGIDLRVTKNIKLKI